MPNDAHIGTSGWHYDHWKGAFYPADLAASDMLSYYAERFSTVEINNSFYRLPDADTLRSWKDTVDDDFVFSFKASRYLTHMKKLKDPAEPLCNVYQAAEMLGDKLGPILFQLPPRWHCNTVRLRQFLETLSAAHRHVFEFRDDSWFNPQTYDLLEKHGAAFCIYDLEGETSPMQVTADFVYVRLHGPGAPYRGRYGRETLSGWSGAVSSWLRHTGDVFVYFDNDDSGYAPANAGELRDMVLE